MDTVAIAEGGIIRALCTLALLAIGISCFRSPSPKTRLNHRTHLFYISSRVQIPFIEN